MSRVEIVGLVPSGPSGVRDYGQLLGAELGRQGFQVAHVWIDSDGKTIETCIGASFRLLRCAFSLPRDSIALWQYSPFVYGVRGISLPGVLFGVLLRLRGVPVITTLHELGYRWGRRGWRGRMMSVTQWTALYAVLVGSDAVVVTTEERAVVVRRYQSVGRRVPVHVIPVFSTVGEDLEEPGPKSGIRLGVIGYSAEEAQPDLFFASLSLLDVGGDLETVLLGAPGPESPAGERWSRLARSAHIEDRLTFTGICTLQDLSREMRACDVVLLLDAEGPTGRRTMLAAALAHGCPVVATDGPNSWKELLDAGAVVAVPPEPLELAGAVTKLCGQPEQRMALGRRARDYYVRHLSLEHAARSLSRVITEVDLEHRRRRSRWGR